MRSTRYTACAIALAASLSMPVFAQGTGPNNTTGSPAATTPATESVTPSRSTDDGFNWGWLGLLGLAGLMGLRKQPDVHRTDATRTSMQR